MSLRRRLMMRMGVDILGAAGLGEKFDDLLPEYARLVVARYRQEMCSTNFSEHGGDSGNGAVHDMAEAYAALSVDWAKQGFPLIEPSQKLAASLMATSIPAGHVQDIRVPWKLFAIAVPSGLLSSGVPGGTTWEHLVVASGGDGQSVVIFAQRENDGTLDRWSVASLEELSAVKDDEFWQDAQPLLKKARELLSRLVLGCCIEFERAYGHHVERPARTSPRLKRGDPRAWSFKLAREIRVDCRPWVARCMTGKGAATSVQVLVRGHHK